MEDPAAPSRLARYAAALRPALTFAVDWLLPPRCLNCGAGVASQGSLCADCWRAIVFISDPVCARCGLPLPFVPGFRDADGAIAECAECAAHPPLFDRARTVMVYDDRSRRLVLALKHADRLQGVATFGLWLARSGAALLEDADCIAPVPLHWARLFRRRYNQAALLAGATAAARKRMGLAAPRYAPDLLRRNRLTPSQGHLTRKQRSLNVRGAFSLGPTPVEGLRIVLVDDVLTSGATVGECARILRRAGAARVDVLTLARAVRLG